MSEKIILASSNEAAQIKTVTGWFDRFGHFWGEDERTARYSGGTHKTCEDCGNVYLKNSWCEPCYKKKQAAKFEAMPRRVWDGVEPICLFDGDKYFFDCDIAELEEYAEECQCEVDDLRLVFCEPQYATQLEPYDLYQDLLPEDGELPDEIIAAIDVFNAAIKDLPPLSWLPGKVAVALNVPTAEGEQPKQ